MKFISGFSSKKMLSVGLLVLTVSITHAAVFSRYDVKKVFWNKFEASVKRGNVVVLTWNVTEYNNKNFLVQYSINGSDWVDIELIESQNSKESMTDYSYEHKTNYKGRQYYRLRALDVDNKSKSISPVIAVVLGDDQQTVTIWPNPATSYIVINNADKGNMYSKALIFDVNGKIVTESKLDPDFTKIAVNDLPAGAYIVKIENEKGTAVTQKFIKQ
jgi:Secretion system C-terminal sorting domain